MENTFVAKHRRQETNTATRAVAAATAAVAGATLIAPTAGATEVGLPNFDAIPGLADNVQAAVDAARNVPAVNAVPELNNAIEAVQSQFAPAAPAANVAAVADALQLPAAEPAPAVNKGQQIVDIARAKVGAPYVYGAAGPAAFDCSGFTSWVYSQAGINIPRTSQAQASAGQRVPLDQLQPGDIVAYYGGASHVAIYAGNGQIIDALNSGIPVGYRSLNLMPIHSAFRFH